MQINCFGRIFSIVMIRRNRPAEGVSKWGFEGRTNKDRKEKKNQWMFRILMLGNPGD